MKVNMGLENNMSRSLAMLELVENITSSIDDCKSTVGIFIDLNKFLILLTMIFSYKNLTIME